MNRRFSLSDQVVSGNRLLRVYSYYSLILALLIILTTGLDTNQAVVGKDYPALMLVASALLVLLASVFTIFAYRSPEPQLATGYIFIEIALLACMMLSSGGLGTGFANLIIISVVVSNLLTPGVLGYGVAAWTTLVVFYTNYVWGDPNSHDTIGAGMFGFLCFTLAFLSQNLSRHLSSTLNLASEQATSIRRLQRFSQQALMDMPDGIIACDQQHRILFFNQRALQWFMLKEGDYLPYILRTEQLIQTVNVRGESLCIRQVKPHDSERGDYLLEIEDNARLAAEAQQIKLASLGRLTASIAHEIRNPLSALRQASQLLSESDHTNSEDRYLTTVIEQHCMRINHIIEDVLQLSKRKQSNIETLRLLPWLKHFKEQFTTDNSAKNFQMIIDCDSKILIPFDADHLQQILHNLCNNGLRYALKASPENALLIIKAEINELNIELDIIDNGAGVSDNHKAHLFEPFHTSEKNGTGLGLYLCRELCEANQARIQYYELSNGSCFRLTINNSPLISEANND